MMLRRGTTVLCALQSAMENAVVRGSHTGASVAEGSPGRRRLNVRLLQLVAATVPIEATAP